MNQTSLFIESFDNFQEIIEEAENVLSTVLDDKNIEQTELDTFLNKLSFIINKQVRINIDQFLFQQNTPAYNSMLFNCQCNLQPIPYVNNNYCPLIAPNIFTFTGQPQLMNQPMRIRERNRRKKNKSSIKHITLKQSKGPKSNDKSKKRTVPAPELNLNGQDSIEAFESAIHDQSLKLSPQQLGFLPSNYWLNLDSTFGDLVTKFFRRKNNHNCSFPIKLFNALLIVENKPDMFKLVGVKWITNNVFKVNKFMFGRLLGIKSVDGLFYFHGSFESFGFVQLSLDEIDQIRVNHQNDIADVDNEVVRLMKHKVENFTKTSSEDSIKRIKWGIY